jgi:hypothetical protein
MRSRRAALALVAWTFLVWTTRIANIWRDEALDTAGKVGRTALALSFTLLAVAVLVAIWRRLPARTTRAAVFALAAWTTGVWIVRGIGIAAGDHEAAFIVVHLVLAVVSITLAALAVRRERQLDAAGEGAGTADAAAGARPSSQAV